VRQRGCDPSLRFVLSLAESVTYSASPAATT
jgi:hypothetical protein